MMFEHEFGDAERLEEIDSAFPGPQARENVTNMGHAD